MTDTVSSRLNRHPRLEGGGGLYLQIVKFDDGIGKLQGATLPQMICGEPRITSGLRAWSDYRLSVRYNYAHLRAVKSDCISRRSPLDQTRTFYHDGHTVGITT